MEFWNMWKPIFLALLLWAFPAMGSDLIREQRYAQELQGMLVVGEGFTLKAGDADFFAIHAEAETSRLKGAVILLHGRGGHPNWPDVIWPLRTELAGSGWETLSIQMPVAGPDSDNWIYEQLIPEAAPRLAAAIAFLKEREIDNIVVIGHSLGARMGAHFLAAGTPQEVSAFVAIGMMLEPAGSQNKTGEALANIKIPVLDIYGSRDLDSVRNSVRQRAAAARKAENSAYRQISIAGADHFFHGLEGTLVGRVRAWIARAAPGKEAAAEETSAEETSAEEDQSGAGAAKP
jgi:pimeloyl-ACP methyl ester carboxylesterase